MKFKSYYDIPQVKSLSSGLHSLIFFTLSGLEPYSSEIFHLSAKMAEMVFRRYKKIFELLVFVTSKLLLLSGKKELLNDSDVTSLSHKMCEF